MRSSRLPHDLYDLGLSEPFPKVPPTAQAQGPGPGPRLGSQGDQKLLPALTPYSDSQHLPSLGCDAVKQNFMEEGVFELGMYRLSTGRLG